MYPCFPETERGRDAPIRLKAPLTQRNITESFGGGSLQMLLIEFDVIEFAEGSDVV